MKVWTVDAFTQRPFAGNPAAIAIVNQFPTNTTCQNLAAEMNLSETVFVKPLTENHFHIRWFTPLVEIELCGHATLAAAHILFQEKRVNSDKMSFDSLSGKLWVTKQDGLITLDFPLQKTGPVLDTHDFQELLDIEVISAEKALDDILIEVSENNLLRYEPNLEKISRLDCRGLIMTAKSSKDYDFISRFFAPRVGVLEDPVTGSAHCKLADYWQKKLNKTHFLAYQASKRGGELKLTVAEDRVYIAGNAVTVMQGEWIIPI